MMRAIRQPEFAVDYGASWTTLFLSPIFGAFSAWFGVGLIAVLAHSKVAVLGSAFTSVHWDSPMLISTLTAAFLLGFGERMFDSLVEATHATTTNADPAKPTPPPTGSTTKNATDKAGTTEDPAKQPLLGKREPPQGIGNKTDAKYDALGSGTEPVLDAISKTLARAAVHGGEVQLAAEVWLSECHWALVAIEQQLKQAHTEYEVLHEKLMERDNESDLEIAAVIDEIWDCLGKPTQSIDYDLIVRSGKSAWIDGDPVKQPHFMQDLAKNIRDSQSPKLAEKKEAWATRIEQKATAQAHAATPLSAADAKVNSLTMQRRTLANAGRERLTRLKHAIKYLPLTDAQIQEIIPNTLVATSSTLPILK